MSSQSVVGGSIEKPGDPGYTAPWVYMVVPDFVPWSVWYTLETILGNMLAHDFLMIIIANDKQIIQELERKRYNRLPGQKESQIPSWRRIQALADLLNRAGKKTTGGTIRKDNLETAINAYTTLINSQHVALRDLAIGAGDVIDENKEVSLPAPCTVLPPRRADPCKSAAASTDTSDFSAAAASNTVVTSAGTSGSPRSWLAPPQRSVSPARTEHGFPAPSTKIPPKSQQRITGKLLI